jgi:hypothetical protein
MPSIALAQSSTAVPPHVPLQKTIGQAGVEVEPSMIVLNSRGVSMEGGKLTLTGVSPNAIVFADRPVRAAGHAFTSYLLEEWAEGATFAEDPPNATVSAFSKDGSTVRDAVVVLKSPKTEGEQVTFDVEVLEGDLTGSDGPASIFIDRFGFAYRGGFGRARVGRVGFDRVGFRRVDVGRFGVGGVHVARGGAWYRGAATAVGVGAAAATAAAAPVLLAPDASAPVVAAPVITAPVGAAPVAAAPAGSTAASGAVAQSVNPLAVLGACRPDIRSFCSTVSAGNGRIKTCMKQHLHQLSEPCKEALFQAWLQE